VKVIYVHKLYKQLFPFFAAAAGNQDPFVDSTADGKKEDEIPQKKPAAESQSAMDTDEDADKKEVSYTADISM